MSCNDVLSSVKEKAHYEIALRPRSPSNFTFSALEGMMDECRVQCREYPYPYGASGKSAIMRRLERCIELSHDTGMCMGVWRFCKSGQFKQYLALPEARWPKGKPHRVGIGIPPREKFLEPTVTLYQISEVFLFARRLARAIPDVWTISISLHDMQDRMLDIRVPERFGLYGDYKCGIPVISISVDIHHMVLQSSYADLAIEKTLEVTGRFGWSGKDLEQTLRHEQEKMYRLREARAMPVASSPA